MGTHGRPRRAFVVGLTGGPASGKSSLASLLRRRGAATYAVDEAAHALYRPGQPAHRAVLRAFGDAVRGPGGAIDRAALGRAVFGSPSRLRALERVLHPRLRRLVPAAIRRLRTRHALVAVEAGPLLVRLGLLPLADLVVWTRCATAERVRRLAASRGLAPSQARARLRALAGAEEELARALAKAPRVLVVRTDGPPDGLRRAADRIMAAAGDGRRG